MDLVNNNDNGFFSWMHAYNPEGYKHASNLLNLISWGT